MKIKKMFYPFLLIVTLLSTSALGQQSPIQKGLNAINEASVKAQLEFLSSDWMEGRATGEKGEFLSADYISSMLQFMGVDPAGDKEYTSPSRAERWSGVRPEEYISYFQNIYMTRRLESWSNLALKSALTGEVNMFTENVDYSIYGPNQNIQLNSGIVFVGYGFVNKKSGYDDYKGLDVKDKIIVRLEGYPGHKDTNSVGYKRFHKDERNFEYNLGKGKDNVAKEKGVSAIIDIYESNDPKYWIEKRNFQQIDYNEHPSSPNYENRLSLPTETIDNRPLKIYPSKKIVNKIFETQGINIDILEKQFANSVKPQSKILLNMTAKVEYKVKTDLVQTRNVLGVIEGENKDEIVVVGGHYDHLGARDGFVWNGADDNASGTVGVLMLAKAFRASGIKPKKTIVFAAWTGEEKGLLGSKYFAEHPYGGSIENIKFYLNFDMISKDSDNDTLKNKASMRYTESLTDLENLTKKHIEEYDLNLDLRYRPSKKPRGGSDHSSFSAKNIPIMYFMAGFPVTYHTPKDGTSDINWDKMVDIIKLSFLNLWEFVNEE